MMLILREIERTPEGLSQAQLLDRTGLARSTVYRMLNSLLECGILREPVAGRFVLGGRLLELAYKVTPASDFVSMVRFLQPVLDRLAVEIGQTCKLSVFERGAIMLVAGALARTPHAMSYSIGEYLPLHAGGASKVLMSALSRAERLKILGENLSALTPRTIVDFAELDRELDIVAAQGWSEDPGEYSLTVCSFAAPISDRRGNTVAALSVPFVAATDAIVREQLKVLTIAGAEQLSEMYRQHSI